MLIDEIKAIAKDGADLSGIEGQLKEMNPLSGLQTKEQAWELIKSNPFMLSAFDSEVSKSVNSGVENFKSKGMLEILKEKEAALRAEYNPEESDADKQLREVQEQLRQMRAEKEMNMLQDQLSNKAKEIGFDPLMARKFAVYGEKATGTLEEFAQWHNKSIEDRLSSELKGQYTKKQPSTSSKPNTVQMSRAEYNQMSPYEQRSFVVDQKGTVVDE